MCYTAAKPSTRGHDPTHKGEDTVILPPFSPLVKKGFLHMFKMELVCSGSFLDNGYRMETRVVRLNRDAMEEWNAAQFREDEYDFQTSDQFLAYYKRQAAKMEAFEDKVLQMFGANRRFGVVGGSVTRCVGDIFTVVLTKRETRSTETEEEGGGHES